MATSFFPTVNVGVQANSPVSGGSSSGSARNKKQRTEAFNAVADQARIIRSIVKDLPALVRAFDAVQKAGKTARLTVVIQGNNQRTFALSKEDFDGLMEQLTRGITNLPKMAKDAVRTHREISPGAGFGAPQYYKDELVNFFRSANVGNRVTGTMTTDRKGKAVPNATSLQLTNQRLNDILYFTSPTIGNSQNPLYRVATSGMLTPLFSLHLRYAGNQNNEKGARLTATSDMRQRLGGILKAAIDNDYTAIASALGPSSPLLSELAATYQLMIAAISNPDLARALPNQTKPNELAERVNRYGKKELVFEGVSGPITYVLDAAKGRSVTIFNPNSFPFAHISKLISAAKVPLQPGQTKVDKQLLENNTNINNTYANFYPDLRNDPGFANMAYKSVLDLQSREIKFALDYKSNLRNAQLAAAKKEQKTRERQRTNQAGFVPFNTFQQQPQQQVQGAPFVPPQAFYPPQGMQSGYNNIGTI